MWSKSPLFRTHRRGDRGKELGMQEQLSDAKQCSHYRMVTSAHGCWVTGTAVCGTPGTTTHSKVKAFCAHIEFELGEMLKIYKQELVLQRR